MQYLRYLLLSALALQAMAQPVQAEAPGEDDAAAPPLALKLALTLDSLPAPVVAAAASVPAPAAAPADRWFDAPAVAADQLGLMRGGADTVSNDMSLSGTVANNTAVNVATGMNTISNGSFSNASGLPVAIQNSGANVLIQNATIINVQIQ
jgi:hypothetical protein